MAGRGALLRHLPEYISQSQQLSIDYLDPTKILNMGPNISPEMQSLIPFMLSEPVGLASSLFLEDETKRFAPALNLLPSSKISSLGFKKKKPLLYAACIIFPLLPLPQLIKSTGELKKLKSFHVREISATEDMELELSQKKKKHEKFLFTDRLADEVKKQEFTFHSKARNLLANK